jgi:hypothetical protein
MWTVYGLYQRWNATGATLAVHDALRGQARRAAGRTTEPTAAVIDSQHSAACVNRRCLRCSVRPESTLGATRVCSLCLSWDAITRLHQSGRCCSQFGCSRRPHVAAGTTKKRSDKGRRRNRPFGELMYSA